MNFQNRHYEYPMYLLEMEIGTFIEEYTPTRKVKIKLGPLVMKNLYDIRFLYFSQYEKDGIVGDKETRRWISWRVFPRTRQNCDELLEMLGLSEYDQIEIFKKNSGMCGKDRIWVKFDKNMTAEKLYSCYDYKKVVNDPFWKYNEGFVPKTIQELGFNAKVLFYHRDDR